MTPLTDTIIDPICSMREPRKVGENKLYHFIKAELASRILAVTTPIFASFEIFMQVMEVLIVNPLALLGSEAYCALTRSDPREYRELILQEYKHDLSRIVFCAAMIFWGPTVGVVYPKAFETFSVTQFKKKVKQSNPLLNRIQNNNPEYSRLECLLFVTNTPTLLKDYKYLPYVDPYHWRDCKRYAQIMTEVSQEGLRDPRLVSLINRSGISEIFDTRNISNIQTSGGKILEIMRYVEAIGIIGRREESQRDEA